MRKCPDFHKETEGISGNYRPSSSRQNPGRILVQIIKQMAWECLATYSFIYLYFAAFQKEDFSVAYRETCNTEKLRDILIRKDYQKGKQSYYMTQEIHPFKYNTQGNGNMFT